MKNDIKNIPYLDEFTIHENIKKLNNTLPKELANLLEGRTLPEKILILSHLSPKLAATTFEYMNFTDQKEIMVALPSQVATSLLNEMAPDDRTQFFEELPDDILDKFITYLTSAERNLTERLLSYPENSVGRIMTTDYISIKQDWTVKQVFEFIRKHGRNSETISVLYVVDDKGKLIDDIRIRDLIFALPDTIIEELLDHRFIAIHVNATKDEAINIFAEYDSSSLPVVDANNLLLGIITFDDILNLAIDQTTEDIQMIGGTEALDIPYMQTDILTLVKKRASWLIVLFLGELLTASVLGYYEDQISKAVVLALFLPLIVSSGGNAGSQACTLIIRAMALGEIKLKDYWRVMNKEIISGLLLGVILGSIGFLRIILWTFFSDIYGTHWFLVALTISFSLIGVILWGTISGSMLPFVLRRLGHDPAMSSAPFIATIVDVTGLFIYFNVAIIILGGTLL